MIKDYLEVRNAEGMAKLADSTIALDFMIAAKTAVRNCAIALSEAATPEVRAVLQQQLEQSLDMHDQISELMTSKGWFYPFNLEKQFQIDMEASTTAVQIAQMDIFSGDTSRLGTFATPEQ
jgi:similar to spore coat protein